MMSNCNSCNRPRPKCKSCKKCGCDPCGCNHCSDHKPTLSIDEVPENPSMLKYNINGVSAWYDYDNLVYQTQTDTVLSADAVNRVLKYMAERHVDTISAKELGSILHIADIADVDVTGIGHNALFVYQKDSNCGEGCEGIDNSWIAWNAEEHQGTSLQTAMGFDADGSPLALATPTNADQYYMLGWNAGNKLSYTKPVQFNDTTNKAPLYVDKTTGQIGWYEE